MRLQVLQVVQALMCLHHDRKLILTFVRPEVLFTAVQDVVYALEGDGEHFDILKFEDAAQCLNNAFLD